jgi:IS30 family transposase
MARKTLMQQLVEHECYCCPFAYLRVREKESARDIARHLGVTPRTIRLYRQRIKNSTEYHSAHCSEVAPETISDIDAEAQPPLQ